MPNDDQLPPLQDQDGFSFRHRQVEQGSLFPTEDVIIPDSIVQFRKPVAAIHAMPLKAEHSQTLNGRRLFDACLMAVQVDFKRRGEEYLRRVIDDRVSPLFDLRVNDLARLAKIPGKNYERIYEEMDTLYETSFAWNVIGEDASVQWRMKSHFLSSLGIGEGAKKGMVRFSIDPAILKIILEPSVWATLALKPVDGLRTAPSYALYQNCWRYVGTQNKVTPDWPVETWVDLLVGPSRYVVEVKGGGRRVHMYGDFKRRVLLDAIARVNEVAALNYTLELKEGYSGRRVSRLQFKLIPKKQATLGLPLLWPKDVLDVLERMGLTHAEVEDLSQLYSYEVVAESMVQLKSAVERMNAAGKRIHSKKAYFRGILANLAAGGKTDEIDLDEIERQARLQEAERHTQERRQRLEEGFARHVATVFAERFFAMEEEERGQLIDAFTQSTAGAQAKLLLDRGWTPTNRGALSVLRGWLASAKPDVLATLLPNAEEQSVDGYMAWKADQAGL